MAGCRSRTKHEVVTDSVSLATPCAGLNVNAIYITAAVPRQAANPRRHSVNVVLICVRFSFFFAFFFAFFSAFFFAFVLRSFSEKKP